LKKGIIYKVSEALKTVKDVTAGALQTGEVLASEKDFLERVGICNECPQLSGRSCRVCGCTVDYKAKLKFAKCPITKW
jgi:hypothetical protein